jgi:hypothetical protein
MTVSGSNLEDPSWDSRPKMPESVARTRSMTIA